MRYAYPCTLTPEEDGGFTVAFPDVPEALTGGDSRAESLELAKDALATALAGYIHEKRAIPTPGPASTGDALVPVPPVVASKLALHSAMREQGVSKSALAKLLGVSEGAVRRLCDADHRSEIEKVNAALAALGRCLVVEDRAA